MWFILVRCRYVLQRLRKSNGLEAALVARASVIHLD
jgi:hypothetical protein